MSDEHSLLAWAKSELQAINEDLKQYEHGLRTGESVNGGPWLDTTEKEVATLKGRARRLEAWIAKHDAALEQLKSRGLSDAEAEAELARSLRKPDRNQRAKSILDQVTGED